MTDESKNLISKFLIVEPEKRISVEAALKHPVFQANREDEEVIEQVGPVEVEKVKKIKSQKSFKKKRKSLKVILMAIRFTVRIGRLRFTPEPLSLQDARTRPYSMRMFRKVIDNGAFRIYSHWVKKGEGQNRAALFEHYPKKNEKNNQL